MVNSSSRKPVISIFTTSSQHVTIQQLRADRLKSEIALGSNTEAVYTCQEDETRQNLKRTRHLSG